MVKAETMDSFWDDYGNSPSFILLFLNHGNTETKDVFTRWGTFIESASACEYVE